MKLENAVKRAVCTVAYFPEVRKVTHYHSPVETVKATATGRRRVGERQVSILVTIGKPNYAERKFIKLCQKAGVPFPVRKVQLKYWPAKKSAKKKRS